MVSFQLRHNLLITVFIIVIIGIAWLLMQGLSYSFNTLQEKEPAPLTQNEVVSKEVSYVEKIDNFVLQEFGANQQLSHFVEAKSYFNFKGSPALLLDPKVTTYNEKGEVDYILTSKRANYLDSGQKILTKDLYIDQSNGQKHYYSGNDTTYLAPDNKIYASGIDMDMRKEIVQLLGKVKILQNSGSKINTEDLIVDQSGESEIYRTKERIHYQSEVADIYATGMRYDAKNQKIKLTGGVVGRYE